MKKKHAWNPKSCLACGRPTLDHFIANDADVEVLHVKKGQIIWLCRFCSTLSSLAQ